MVFKVSQSNVAVAAKNSTHLIRLMIVINYEFRRALFNMDATDSARMVLLFEYCLAILIRLTNNPAIDAPAIIT